MAINSDSKVLDSDTKIHVKPKVTVQSVAIKSETQMWSQWFLGGITNTHYQNMHSETEINIIKSENYIKSILLYCD